MVPNNTSTPIQHLAAQTRRILRQTLLLSASLITIVPSAIAAPALKTAIAPRSIASPIANGTYVYGETAKPNQLGSAYLVFEVRNQQLSGAVYWPGSSFECLSGNVQPNRLALTIAANPQQPATTRDIPLTQNAIVASNGKAAPIVGLEGMHPIGTLSDNDRRILKTCQAQ
jgi:hypothetical protein